MLRSSILGQAVRRYATTPAVKPAAAKADSDVFLKNLLEKVKTIKDQPQGNNKVNMMNNNKNGSFSQNRNRNNNKNNNSNRSRGGNGDNKKNNNNNRRYNKRSQSANNTDSFPQQQFSGAEYARQRRAKNEKKFGSGGESAVFDSASSGKGFYNKKGRNSSFKSIFATSKSGTRVSSLKRSRTRGSTATQDKNVEKSVEGEMTYVPQKPALPDLIKYSSNLSFSQESRLTRAVFQVLQRHYQVPDLYTDSVDILDQGKHVIIQQPLSTYPYDDKLPLSNKKIMGPTIIDIDFDHELLSKVIDKAVFGKFEDLKITVKDDKLKLNAQVVQNSLNRNVFFNYSERKERIYKSCAGLDTVKSLTA